MSIDWYKDLPTIRDKYMETSKLQETQNCQQAVTWVSTMLKNKESNLSRQILYRASQGQSSTDIFYYDVPVKKFTNHQQFIDQLNQRFNPHLQFRHTVNDKIGGIAPYFEVRW